MSLCERLRRIEGTILDLGTMYAIEAAVRALDVYDWVRWQAFKITLPESRQ